eukprot:TRINITY_DN2407_c0_g1_i3.p1 TRINITY_DN2407_c0_g1~~TRINITY_DN2407_c0_g1_i3.p1  ORF type:complete len:755 (-),score=133.02 TRINITY_DN2407_c0_g1_i3:44-2020(-)
MATCPSCCVSVLRRRFCPNCTAKMPNFLAGSANTSLSGSEATGSAPLTPQRSSSDCSSSYPIPISSLTCASKNRDVPDLSPPSRSPSPKTPSPSPSPGPSPLSLPTSPPPVPAMPMQLQGTKPSQVVLCPSCNTYVIPRRFCPICSVKMPRGLPLTDLPAAPSGTLEGLEQSPQKAQASGGPGKTQPPTTTTVQRQPQLVQCPSCREFVPPQKLCTNCNVGLPVLSEPPQPHNLASPRTESESAQRAALEGEQLPGTVECPYCRAQVIPRRFCTSCSMKMPRDLLANTSPVSPPAAAISPSSISVEAATEKGIVIEDSVVKAGTPEALVAHLLSQGDSNFMNHYLLTHSAHTTYLRLLQLLSDQFEAAEPQGKVSKVIPLIRLRVFQVLKTWVDLVWNTSTDATLISKTKEFAYHALSLMPSPAPAQQLLKQIDKVTQPDPQEKLMCTLTKKMFKTPPPAFLYPLSVGLGVLFTASSCSFDDMHPKELARQMTLLDYQLFASVKPWEFIGLAWTKPDKSLAPNLAALSKHFNDMSNWIMHQICSTRNLQHRIYTVEKIIDIAQHCLDMNNFNGILQIMSALNRTPVTRLKKTWEGISLLHRRTFTALDQLTATNKSYAQLRHRIHNSQPPCVPYVGTYAPRVGVGICSGAVQIMCGVF